MTMDPKALAAEILKMLLNGMEQMHANTTGDDGHSECWSKENVESFCRERANNLAAAMPALIYTEDCGDASCTCCKLNRAQADGTLPAIRAKAEDELPSRSPAEAMREAMHYTNRAIKRWSGNSSIVGVQPGESSDE